MLERVEIDGRHLALGGAPFRVRGATYGSFVGRLDGESFPERSVVKRDFRAMAEAGLNTVRTYTLPPADVVDIAGENGLRLLVGLHHRDWRMEPEATRAARRRVLDAGRRAVDAALDRLAGEPVVLGVAVGNEVPVDVVRLHGSGAVADVLADLVARVHAGDEALPATYVNFPTTEFLEVEGSDLVCFNVFLERPAALRSYLRHLRVLAGDRPLLVTELGLAAALHGEDQQASSLEDQLRVVDEEGCDGATVFAWTDEWGVAGQQIEGWGFGLTGVDRRPKPALAVVEGWARRGLPELRPTWPRVSVVVCAYNEEATIGDCLSSLARSTYPDLEVIVCDDGSTDRTAEVASSYPCTLLPLAHGGLSAARNVGLATSTGSVVAYLDADAVCHEDWPYHLVLSLEDDGVVATGGPNLPALDAGLTARAVDLSPGKPVEVLLAADRAEHVPGCNMAFRRKSLVAIGGFDVAYTSAGDDVDVCWKLLERDDEIAFAPAAQVRHHRRTTVRGYLRQQRGYGRAERMLSGAHAHRFNRLGQARWDGVIYGRLSALPRFLRPVVYHGYLGTAPFQPVARRPSEDVTMWGGALVPFAVPAALSSAAFAPVAAWSAVLAAVLAATVVGYALVVAAAVTPSRDERHPLRLRLLVGALHVLQPLWRAWGRLRASPLPSSPRPRRWSGDRAEWLDRLGRELQASRCSVGVTANRPWDLSVAIGPLLRGRVTAAVLWGWEPGYAVALHPRRSCWLVIAAVLSAAVVGAGWVALGAAVALFLGLLSEAVALRRRIDRAIWSTTHGAGAEAS